jgi:hypothetical protein
MNIGFDEFGMVRKRKLKGSGVCVVFVWKKFVNGKRGRVKMMKKNGLKI